MGLITCLGIIEKKKISCPGLESNSWPYPGHCIYYAVRAMLGQTSGVCFSRQNMDKYSGVCYNEQFLSIKSGCYNERGGILSADIVRACA